MPSGMLGKLGALLIVIALVAGIRLMGEGASLDAHAEGADLLKGCTDVPEAVALAQRLQTRALRIDRYLQELDRRKAEIGQAETRLSDVLTRLAGQRNASRSPRQDPAARKDVDEDIIRLVAVYDQMKPADAALVISNLPPEFAAELLMRVQPENSARIIAAVEPNQAAILTSYMGSRRARGY
ncbi:hypothetical protein [uncultured Paracoccus sp.]|uniref:MotE family protein n=1 Tax=uncultured Paracoccus sp. TaxID=189685 RepID=UPI0025DCD3DC|nr:hypothetical protein [uncultured Paracoccus sp.]